MNPLIESFLCSCRYYQPGDEQLARVRLAFEDGTLTEDVLKCPDFYRRWVAIFSKEVIALLLERGLPRHSWCYWLGQVHLRYLYGDDNSRAHDREILQLFVDGSVLATPPERPVSVMGYCNRKCCSMIPMLARHGAFRGIEDDAYDEIMSQNIPADVLDIFFAHVRPNMKQDNFRIVQRVLKIGSEANVNVVLKVVQERKLKVCPRVQTKFWQTVCARNS